ncbi:hypothetical protein B0H11DRAFT_2126498 [Mycena galericulata]|nr:hypothetical protein B0H11DRAFT_2126498 [Mycena galericulata]
MSSSSSSTAPSPAVHAALSLLFITLASFILTVTLLPFCGLTVDSENISLLMIARVTGAWASVVFVCMNLILGLLQRRSLRRGGDADHEGTPDVECKLDVRDIEAAVGYPSEKAEPQY